MTSLDKCSICLTNEATRAIAYIPSDESALSYFGLRGKCINCYTLNKSLPIPLSELFNMIIDAERAIDLSDAASFKRWRDRSIV